MGNMLGCSFERNCAMGPQGLIVYGAQNLLQRAMCTVSQIDWSFFVIIRYINCQEK